MTNSRCRICASPSCKVGEKKGKYIQKSFALFACRHCGFYYVEDACSDLEQIYDRRYYDGAGADPMIDYVFEIAHRQTTIRNYEWQGVADVLASTFGDLVGARWLDFGCGNGGLVRYGNEQCGAEVIGFDEGYSCRLAMDNGVRILERSELDSYRGCFDIITAIEVLEHCLDPLVDVRLIRTLLKPGGVFFYTTGNSQPFANNILKWPYFIPEIHISLFQPTTMEFLLRECGFGVEQRGFVDGFDSIIRYKILKNLRLKTMNPAERLLPWPFISEVVDQKLKLSAFPIGRG